uniref:Protein CASC3 n=1 Tax=Caenorhabditis japonica TaxID=281687 RepID=A0A8R1HXJ6_CAEJA
MAAESTTTTETKGSNEDSSPNLKENGDPQNPPVEEDDAVPAKKRETKEADQEIAEEEPAASEERSNLDDDQNVENPAYIPKTGRFYMHDDDRRGDIVAEQEEDEEDLSRSLKKSRADGDWKHDRFEEKFQRPKTKKQIVTKYGFDIRHKEGEADPQEVESTEEESSDARAVRPQKDRRVPTSGVRGGKSGQRRPMKQREREDTVDESEEGKGEEENDQDEDEARPAQKRQVKQQHEQKRKQKPSAVPQSSEENEEDEDEDGAIRRGQRRTVPLRRGTSGPPFRLRGRMSHPMPPQRRPSGGTNPLPRESPTMRTNGRDKTQPSFSRGPPRREYHADNRDDDRFENHRRGVIRGASRGVGSRGYSRGGAIIRGRGGDRGGSRYQGTRRADTSEQSEGYRGSGTDYSSPRSNHHQKSPTVPSRGNSGPSSAYRGGSAHPTANVYPQRGGYQNDYAPRGNYHGPAHHGGPSKQQHRYGPPPQMGPHPPMVAVGVVPGGAVPPPQMTRGATHGSTNHGGNHHNGGSQQNRIRQPTDVVYFDPQQQQGNRQLPQRSKKVIPIVDPNKAEK